MGGGTWIYLGQFYFHKGKNDNGKVVLTNLTGKKGETVTADAVKFGGGMGNIARFFNQKGTIPHQKSSDKTAEIAALLRPDSAFDWKYQPQTSGYPRFSEGARYWCSGQASLTAYTVPQKVQTIMWTITKAEANG
jgi:hypothetical protein